MIRDKPLMIWGGSSGKIVKKNYGWLSWRKNLNSHSPEEKIDHLWSSGKNNEQRIAKEEKIEPKVSFQCQPPQIINGPSLIKLCSPFLFVVLIQTYDRLQALRSCLKDLKGLLHLDKVVVIWNNPTEPPTDTTWPDIGVPLLVSSQTKHGSNRYTGGLRFSI